MTAWVAWGLLVPVTQAQQTSRTATRGSDQSGKKTKFPVLRFGDREPAIQLLRKHVESVDWQDEPFEGIIDWLRQEGEGRVNIVPRWAQLNVESVDRDTPVNLQMNNTTVAEVLNEVLYQLSENGELRYRAFGNTLRITTRADTDRRKYLRVYDVTDILFEVKDFGETAPNINLQNTSQGGQGGGGGGQSVFQGSAGGSQERSGGEETERQMKERLEELRDIIMKTIEPQSWNTGTGPVVGTGTIEIFNRSLIVYNTIEVHEQIAGRFSFSD
ncbi:MAG: hypothetical protein D6788_01415 [Planctomycetota bacterium]|nr:MAG: hypothetical protein D6788_01415 [Planctomycetota bacterium]